MNAGGCRNRGASADPPCFFHTGFAMLYLITSEPFEEHEGMNELEGRLNR
jgi:hypothetical protein